MNSIDNMKNGDKVWFLGTTGFCSQEIIRGAVSNYKTGDPIVQVDSREPGRECTYFVCAEYLRPWRDMGEMG